MLNGAGEFPGQILSKKTSSAGRRGSPKARAATILGVEVKGDQRALIARITKSESLQCEKRRDRFEPLLASPI